MYMVTRRRGNLPKKQELSPGGWAPCSTLGECSRNPSLSVYQLALL